MADGKAFGQTFMTDDVAEPSDINAVVKAVESFPTDKINGDIVQLVQPLGGYIQGHYYKHVEENGTWLWKDLGEAIDLGFDTAEGIFEISVASGAYPILTVMWIDPTDERWVKSELIQSDGDLKGQQVLMQNFTRHLYQGGYSMTLPIPIEWRDGLPHVPEIYANAKFFIKSTFANGFFKYSELMKQ